MLQASSIHFCIQNRPIVNQASLTVEPGEILAVLGPNGAGKSTLFKILSGDTSCKHGHVSYNGTAIQGLKPAQLAEIRAVMPQHSSVNFPFSAQEVVELGLTTIKPKNPALILDEVMELTQTKHLAKQAFHSLSGGEKQRVQLARVLVQIWEQKPFPRYLLLDEPTSSLDIAQQHGVLGILRKLKARNIGVLIILHELNLAAQYADRIALLKKGNLAACASVPEVMQEQLLSEVFDYPVEVFPHPHQNHWMVSTSSSNYSSMKTQKLA
jgi:iron complex transport system ATP-binding protein